MDSIASIFWVIQSKKGGILDPENRHWAPSNRR